MTAIQAPEIETDEDMQRLYNWVDDIPLSRPKRNIGRDFSDGVLLAEVASHFLPGRVEVHNYPAANSVAQKEYNFKTLNQKVLKRLGWQIHQEDIRAVTRCQAGAVEKVLALFQSQIEKHKANEAAREAEPVAAALEPKPSGIRPQSNRPQSGKSALSVKEVVPPKRHSQEPVAPPMEPDALIEKEQIIHELRETIVIMTEKIKKLEQLVRIKDSKIEALTQKLVHK